MWYVIAVLHAALATMNFVIGFTGLGTWSSFAAGGFCAGMAVASLMAGIFNKA